MFQYETKSSRDVYLKQHVHRHVYKFGEGEGGKGYIFVRICDSFGINALGLF